MRILLTGANGFIGGELMAGLLSQGHLVVAAVRDPEKLQRRFPGAEAIAVDLNQDTAPELWVPRLANVDAVINCAGVLHGGRGQDIEAIHATAPIALFDACLAAGVRKVLQISAISADAEAGTIYALTKKRADDHLRRLDLDWTVLRPSLVYGDGSYGGTSALRGLAGLPLVTPLFGGKGAAFRPIYVDDLVETVARVIEGNAFARRTLEPVGPEVLTMGEIVGKYRRWLGLAPSWSMTIPLPFMRTLTRLVDLAGGGPMGSASLEQVLAGNVGREPQGAFVREVGFSPRSLDVRLAQRRAQTQDLWHARLYFLRPLLRIALAAMWLVSGIAGLLASTQQYADVAAAVSRLGLPASAIAAAFSVIDLLVGLALLLRLWPRSLAVIQLVIVAGYTIGLSFLAPALWLDPFGPLVKNLPILGALAVWWVLEQER